MTWLEWLMSPAQRAEIARLEMELVSTQQSVAMLQVALSAAATECPVCADRRAKHAERVRKLRAKRG